MTLSIFNTMSGTKEAFEPIDGSNVKMFVCGQTVYDDAHLGHAKTYIGFDIVARWLRHSGYKLRYVQNITDVEDKIIARAHERNMEPLALAKYYESRFFEDMERIGVKQNVDMYPESSNYISAMRDQIQVLADKGYAYYLDGDIYYDVSKFKDYTKLSGMDIEELGKHRIEPKEGKRNSYDFALWKAAKPGEPKWKIEIKIGGESIKLDGRPGWHIEDTAMTYSIFGPQYDIHGGARELIFPHHTNEIAQAEGAYGVKPFVKYWMHSGMLNIRGEEMHKSLKNFITIRDFLSKYSAELLRFMIASTHYRKEINFTDQYIDLARKNLYYIYSSFNIFYNMKVAGSSVGEEKLLQAINTFNADFSSAMDDDFNTPLALSKLILFVKDLRSYAGSGKSITSGAKQKAISAVLDSAGVIGILANEDYKKPLDPEIYKLIEEREALRKGKQFEKADAIRARLLGEYNTIVEDTEYGPLWYRR
ncbi:MAG: cysteine--tRNA ligase [Candidatus Micrarchaeaceae archaeon]